MAEDRLHALEFEELGELDLPALGGRHLPRLRPHFPKKARFCKLVALRGLSARQNYFDDLLLKIELFLT